jgi:hypothetical protein
MFRPNCSAIFRLIFEQLECTVDNAFNLRDLVLQELVKIIVVCYIKKLKINIRMLYFYFYFICFNAYCMKIPHLSFNLKSFLWHKHNYFNQFL